MTLSILNWNIYQGITLPAAYLHIAPSPLPAALNVCGFAIQLCLTCHIDVVHSLSWLSLILSRREALCLHRERRQWAVNTRYDLLCFVVEDYKAINDVERPLVSHTIILRTMVGQ